jgi:DNA (cytosine-5)-methyltransferase 1
LTSVELFAGAGGLALGTSLAGFTHKAVVEIDHDACNTIRANQKRGLKPVCDWLLFEADFRNDVLAAKMHDRVAVSGAVASVGFSRHLKAGGDNNYRRRLRFTMPISTQDGWLR